METESVNDVDVLTSILASLKRLSKEDQMRTLKSVATFLSLEFNNDTAHVRHAQAPANPAEKMPETGGYSEDRTISPKEFIRDKAPHTDVDRVACLAFYLTHYRETPYFKTIDISTLNTEAAQPKFSSASVAVDNATRAGLLVQANKGAKQISAAGEAYVQHLPDREAARQQTLNMRRKKNKKMPPKRSKFSQ